MKPSFVGQPVSCCRRLSAGASCGRLHLVYCGRREHLLAAARQARTFSALVPGANREVLVRSSDGKHHVKGDKVGAFQSIEQGREADVSCACHWTVNVAASKGHARLYADAYSVAPAGVFVPAAR